MNDNRNYKYSVESISKREEFAIICDLIPFGSKVLDLGCGDGTLLSMLKKKNINGEGIDISSSAVAAARHKGMQVKKGRIDTPLPYLENRFDYAICNVTLQMVMYPEILIKEMCRIAQFQIISFPNFAFILNRLDLLINGRMPRVMIPGYTWYSTGHIHQFSLADFKNFCNINKIQVVKSHYIFPKRIFFVPRIILRPFPNMFASSAIFLTRSR